MSEKKRRDLYYSKYKNLDGAESINSRFYFFIDSPSATFYREKDSFIFEGWIFPKLESEKKFSIAIECDGKIYKICLDKNRADVKRYSHGKVDYEIDVNCGFIAIILTEARFFKFGVEVDGSIVWVRSYEFVAAEKVLIGKDDWLFLDNDTNGSVNQFLGKFDRFRLEEQWIEFREEWENYYKPKSVFCKSLFLIAPSKESIVPEFYPYEAGDVRAIDVVLNSLGGIPHIYPDEILKREKYLNYYRSDTHWTDHAVVKVLDYIFEILGIYKNSVDYRSYFSKLSYNLVTTSGDLGSKLEQRVLSSVFVGDLTEIKKRVVFKNEMVNFGNVIVLENANAIKKECFLVFGSSSCQSLTYLLSIVFSRVVFCHTAGSLDREIVEHEAPHYILQQINERFLIRPAGFYCSVKNTIKAKAKNGASTKYICSESSEKNMFYANFLTGV